MKIHKHDLYYLEVQLLTIYILSPLTVLEWIFARLINIDVLYFDEKTKMLNFPFSTVYNFFKLFFGITYEKIDSVHLRTRFNFSYFKLPLFVRHDDLTLKDNGDYDCIGYFMFLPYKFKLTKLNKISKIKQN